MLRCFSVDIKHFISKFIQTLTFELRAHDNHNSVDINNFPNPYFDKIFHLNINSNFIKII